MAQDLDDQLIEKIKAIAIGLKLEEATDNKDAHLICHRQFVDSKHNKGPSFL